LGDEGLGDGGFGEAGFGEAYFFTLVETRFATLETAEAAFDKKPPRFGDADGAARAEDLTDPPPLAAFVLILSEFASTARISKEEAAPAENKREMESTEYR